MSTASTKVNNLMAKRAPSIFPVSLGYDRVRFLKSVFLGVTITVQMLVSTLETKPQRDFLLRQGEVLDYSLTVWQTI